MIDGLGLYAGHYETALQMIAAQKHVLVEKCFAMNEQEAKEMIDAARQQVRMAQRLIFCYRDGESAQLLSAAGKIQNCTHVPQFRLI